MKSFKLYPKVAISTFYEQFKWSLWFFSILFVIHLGRLYLLNEETAPIVGFFVFSRYSVNIFMLVCGIMLVYAFMGQHVQQGISRKDWYKGTVMAALGLALFVTLVPLAINGMQYVLAQFISWPVEFGSAIAFTSVTGWLAATASFFFNALTYYLIGWLIGIGYYRFGWILGFGFIGLASIAFTINDFFWTDNGLSSTIPWVLQITGNPGFAVAVIGSMILIAVLFATMHLLTRRVPIKM